MQGTDRLLVQGVVVIKSLSIFSGRFEEYLMKAIDLGALSAIVIISRL
jgi:hypothetical protein